MPIVEITCLTGLTAASGDTLLASKWNELVSRTEPVMAHYSKSLAQSCANWSNCVVNFDTKEYDSHDAPQSSKNGSVWVAIVSKGWKHSVLVNGKEVRP